jgi:hypothetical protein
MLLLELGLGGSPAVPKRLLLQVPRAEPARVAVGLSDILK